jgi:hypothetical protein
LTAIVCDSSANYDLCSGQGLVATLDTFAVNNGQLRVDTDTKFCSGHATSSTVSNGSLDHVTIASTAINGELKLDGTNVWIIPITGGSGTAPVPIATSLVPTAASYSAGTGLVTLTFAGAHGYVAGDRIGVGSIKGSELVNGYSGMFTIETVPLTTTLTYAVVEDPGTATITTGKVVKYYKCSQTQTKNISTASWSSNVSTYTTTTNHNLISGNSVVITGASPAGYNGTYTIAVTGLTTFTVAQLSNPGTWTSGGTITKTVISSYLGFWSSWTAGPVTATIAATGWIKVKDLVNGPFEPNVALTIQGGTAPVATAANNEERGWIEVIGAELSTTPAIYTIPRLGKFTVTGDWFYPKTATPFLLTTGTAWAANVTTYTTTTVHGLAIGSFVEIRGTNPAGYDGDYVVVSVPTTTTFTVAQIANPGAWTSGGVGWGEIRTNGVANQTIQLPASGGATVGTTSYAGVWVETAPSSGLYDWYTCVSNATATASMFLVNSFTGKVCYMGAAGLLRFGGDGTNIWGNLPVVGCRIRVGNVISVNATKVVTAGVSTQTVPNATLTSRPKFTTTSAGVVSIDKWMTSWYPTFAQPYSVNMSNVGVCESLLISEISQPVNWDNVNTGISVIASSAQSSALNLATCYAGGTISNCTFNKYHNGTSGQYTFVGTDLQGFTFTNNTFGVSMTTAVGGATARNATSGTMSLTRVADSTFTTTKLFGGRILHTTNTNLTFTTTSYGDSRNSITSATTGMPVHSLSTNTSTIKIDGVDFGGIANIHPYAGIVDVLSASNNIKVRNIGTPTAPLSMGSANACGVLWTGAAGGAGYNLEFKRIYTTLARTGITTGGDNSYNNITYESVWFGNALTYTNTNLNVIAKGLGITNAVAGQTSVYGAAWNDFLTPIGATLAAGTAWAANVTTYTTGAAHNLLAGDVVTISGVVASVFNPTGGYNGTYTVLASGLTSTVFKVDQLSNPGTWTSGGTTNPLLGKIVLQMNEQTSATPAYTFNKAGAGSGFTSVGTLVLLNLDDTITWESPYYFINHKGFTSGAVAPFTVAQPTFTSTNPNNHDWFYDIDKGAGYSGTFKNLHYKASRGAAFWAITGTTTATLTPVTATCVGSIAGSVLTVTSVSAGYLYKGMTLTGTGITAGTVITDVVDSITGKAGTYTVGIMTVAAGTYTISVSSQTVTSTTVTASTSVYGIAVNDNVFDLTTAGNVATNAKVSAITSLVAFTLSLASTNSTLQILAFSAIHSESSITNTGFKLKIKASVNTVATTNSLTTVAVPTLTNSLFQQNQYSLETNTVTFTGLATGTDVVVLSAGTSTILASVDAGGTSSYAYTYTGTPSIDVGFIQQGYVPLYIRGLTLTAVNSSIPVAMSLDRNFS